MKGDLTKTVRFREEIVDEVECLVTVPGRREDDGERVDLFPAQDELLFKQLSRVLHHPASVTRDHGGEAQALAALVTPRVFGSRRLEDATVDRFRGGVDRDAASGQEWDAVPADKLAADVADVAEPLSGLHRLEAGRVLLLLGGEALHVSVLGIDRNDLERVVDAILRLDDRPFGVGEPGAEVREAVLLSEMKRESEVVHGSRIRSQFYLDIRLLIPVDREDNVPRRPRHESAAFHPGPQRVPVALDSNVELLQDPVDLNKREVGEGGEAGLAAVILGLEEPDDEVRESAFDEESSRSRVQRELKTPLARTNRPAGEEEQSMSGCEAASTDAEGTYAKKPPSESHCPCQYPCMPTEGRGM